MINMFIFVNNVEKKERLRHKKGGQPRLKKIAPFWRQTHEQDKTM